MLKNYFKTAFRKLVKNKWFSFINIFGLTIGLTCCLLIALFIRHELSYDDFQINGKRIARVIMEYKFDGSSQSARGNYTSVRVASVFKRVFPEVERTVKMTKLERVVRLGNKLWDEKNFMFADSGFFQVFTFRLLTGDPGKVLTAPNSVVLTRATATRYFGSENPIGRLIQAGNDSSLYRVTGVMEDCPSNSQIKFDLLASFSSLGIGREMEDSYWDANYTTFLLLKTPQSRESLQAKIPAFMKKEMAGQFATVNFWLEPFLSIHLHSEYTGFEPNNNILYIYILAGVAVLILIIVCCTFINLSTALSLERAREIGVRKVIGAGKKQLFWQFIGESAIFCFISLLFSLGLTVLVMPYFNQLTDKQLPVGSVFSFFFVTLSLLVTAVVSLLAGFYPAFILTGFQPVEVLKGSFKNLASGQKLRQSLIVFQFTISVFMIIAASVIQKQLFYIQHKNLGYDRDHVLVLPMSQKMYAGLPLLKQEFKMNPDIISVSACVRSPVEGGGGYNMRSSLMLATEYIGVIANPVDQDFIRTTGMTIVAGQDLNDQDIKDISLPDDKQRVYHFILNESAVKVLGWKPEEAVGKKMFLGEGRPGYVRGVVRDFNFESLHEPIKPMILFPEIRGNRILVKLAGQNLTKDIAFLETTWKTLVPDRPFEYRFLDEDYNNVYRSEMRLGKIMNLFSFLAIILACLGLSGLSSYAVHQRMKEIGIRKVLGASVRNIIILLSGGFMKLTILSLLIALPLAQWSMSKWLQDFTFRTNVGWGIYLATAAVVVLLALITVAFQAIRAAVINPVLSLRSE